MAQDTLSNERNTGSTVQNSSTRDTRIRTFIEREEAQEEVRAMKIVTKDLDLFYGPKQALNKVSLSIPERRVMAFIGPSGCGKSTYLRTLNRMNDLIPGVKISGEVKIDGIDIYDRDLDVVELRKRVGMVFQKSNPFPKSIWENVAYGPKILGESNKTKLNEIVERSLKQAAIWEEVKDRLHGTQAFPRGAPAGPRRLPGTAPQPAGRGRVARGEVVAHVALAPAGFGARACPGRPLQAEEPGTGAMCHTRFQSFRPGHRLCPLTAMADVAQCPQPVRPRPRELRR